MANKRGSSGTRILLIRHGETDWNRIRRFQGRSDLPLNPTGRDQARALALALKDEPLNAIYSSPLVRAMETVNHIMAFHPSVPVFNEEGLVEMDLGDFEGLEAQHWAEQYPDFRKTWQKSPASVKMPGGESLSEVQVRAIDTLKRITQAYPSESTLLLCCHNFVNLTILCYALEVPLDRFREIRQDTAALNILYMKEKQLKAEVVNERSHLQRLKEKMTDKNVSVFTYQIEEADFLRLTSPSAVYNQDIHGQTNIELHHILNNELPYLGF